MKTWGYAVFPTDKLCLDYLNKVYTTDLFNLTCHLPNNVNLRVLCSQKSGLVRATKGNLID